MRSMRVDVYQKTFVDSIHPNEYRTTLDICTGQGDKFGGTLESVDQVNIMLEAG